VSGVDKANSLDRILNSDSRHSAIPYPERTVCDKKGPQSLRIYSSSATSELCKEKTRAALVKIPFHNRSGKIPCNVRWARIKVIVSMSSGINLDQGTEAISNPLPRLHFAISDHWVISLQINS
jgi:hypothetical protein